METRPSPTHSAQVLELETRLAEAEETLRAIREGEVDALLVKGPEGDQVFTLQGAETTYRFLVEEMNEGALLLGSEGTILYANERFACLAQAPLERIIGARWEDFFTPAHPTQLPSLLTSARLGSVREELHLRKDDGSSRPIALSLSYMQRAGVDGFSVVVTDLTERNASEAALRHMNEQLELRVEQRTLQLTRANQVLLDQISQRQRTEEALRQSEERLRLAQKAGRVGVFDWDLKTNQMVWTPELEAIFGLDNGRFENRSEAWFERVDPGDRPAISKLFEEWFRSERDTADWEHRFQRHGETRWIAARGQLIRDARGQPLRMIGTKLDVTERKRAEDILRRNQEELEHLVDQRTGKLQELIDELQHVSYSMVHDLRAPLRAMQGFASVLEEEGVWKPNSLSLDYLQRLKSAAVRMDQLVTDALTYNKAVLHDLPLEDVNLSKLIRGLIDSYPNLHPNQADILVEGELPTVLGNEALLTQCFSNLLGNAVKFVGPKIKPRVRIYSEVIDNGIRIWVEDNGIGIPKGAEARLFGMFQRLSPAYEGTGIGLAIVRKVVERMGGKVGVESEDGQGSRFWVEFQLAQKRPSHGSGRI